jgi:hypothetical protein
VGGKGEREDRQSQGLGISVFVVRVIRQLGMERCDIAWHCTFFLFLCVGRPHGR